MKTIIENKRFAIASGIILFSTIAMGVLMVRYVAEKETVLEASLMQSNARLGYQTLERMEQRILEQDRLLYNYLAAATIGDVVTQLNANAATRAPLVKEIYLVDMQSAILYPTEGLGNWARFYKRKVLPEIQLERIPLLSVHHLHTAIDFRYYLFSFLKFRVPDSDKEYMLVMEFDLKNLDLFFAPYLQDLAKTCHVCVRDYENNVIYGIPFQVSRKYFAEQRFPATFYKWLLQLAPRNAGDIQREAENRQRLNLVLLASNLALILSAWILVFLGRREEIRLTRVKEEFIRNVSHELKTPLALIKMFSEILVMGRGRDEGTRQEYLAIIFAEAERMTFLINNVLDFSNLEQGLQKFCFESLQLGEVVKRHLDAFDYRMKKEKVELLLEEDLALPTIRGDRNAIALILLNLLDNAIKYGGEKAKRIHIRIFAGDGHVCLRVQDNGIGMLPEEIPHVFEKFYRSDIIAVRKVRGSGIGLSLVKYLVDAHQGHIEVESTPGEGTSFTIHFPL